MEEDYIEVLRREQRVKNLAYEREMRAKNPPKKLTYTQKMEAVERRYIRRFGRPKFGGAKNFLRNTGKRFTSIGAKPYRFAKESFFQPASGIFNPSKGLIGGVLQTGMVLGGVAGASKLIQLGWGKRAYKMKPGTPIVSGKRGIDANHLNASGVGLAMHRNRRSF